MKAYRKQIDASKAPKQTQEPVAPAVEQEPKEITKSQDARINFMRGIVADARVRG